MSTKKERNYYSKKQFSELFRNLTFALNKKTFTGCVFEGLWAFSYSRAANSLKHCYFKLLSGFDPGEEVNSTIESAFLDCDHGSLGAAFKELKSDSTLLVKDVLNTFNDAAGVVCYTDAVIKQEHAYFILIREGDDILGIIDLFFSGGISATENNTIKTFLAELFKEGQPLHMQSVIALRLREHEDFLDIQEDELANENASGSIGTDHIILEKITSAVKKLTRITAISSYTPLFYIQDIDGSVIPELVGLNFEYIHSLIKHESSFCPLTKRKDCFYYKQFVSFNEPQLYCDNDFLKKYYHYVMKALDCLVIKQSFHINNQAYELELAYQDLPGVDFENLLMSVTSLLRSSGKKIREHLQLFTEEYNSRPDDVARQKLQDELVFKNIMSSIKRSPVLNSAVIVVTVYKTVNPHLFFKQDCAERNDGKSDVKDLISLSNLLKKRQSEPDPRDEFFEWKTTEKQNVTSFEIYNRPIFEVALRKLIAAAPKEYSAVLFPYLKNVQSRKSDHVRSHDLDVFFTGSNPFEANDNDYLVALNAQMYLLLSLLKGKETVRYARKAAISQVLARNMSHNHGSHVLSRMIHPDQIQALDHMHENLRNIIASKNLNESRL